MKFAQLFLLILAFLVISPAKAGLLIEPVAGYSLAKLDSDDSDNAAGASFGGRLGYQNLGFQLGLDYLRSGLAIDNNDYKADLATSEFAGFVGFEFPILLRVYAGYIFQATGATKYRTDVGLGGGAQTYDLEFDKGTGTKFGVGFTGLPFVDINFEYRKGKLTDGKLGSIDVEDADYSAFMVGISLPFVL
jgi:hypothetical protein